VAVIGGGIGGLTTAALLGKRGLKVVLLEQREALGGLTSTEELVPGVPCDIVDHELGWIPADVLDELGLNRPGLEIARLVPHVTSLVPDSGERVTLYPDVQRTVAELMRHSRRDGAAWPAFAERVAQLSGFLQSLYSVPAPSLFATGAANLLTMLGLGRKVRSLGRAGIFDLLRTLPMSIADVLDETFENAALKGLLASRGVTRILQGPRSGATAFLFLHQHVGLPAGAVRGSISPRGGVSSLTTALAVIAKSHGVAIRTGASVAQIGVRRDRVTGVVLDSGEEINATHVVSSLDARRTMHDLIEPEYVEPELSRAIGHIRMRGATAKVNLAIDAPLPVADDLMGGTFVVAPSMQYLEKAFDSAKHGHVAGNPFLEIRLSDAQGPDGPPASRGVSVLVQWAPYHLQNATWDNAARDALADNVLRTIERVIPGFTSRVVHRQVLSPLDIEQRYGASEGSLTHGELALDQILFMRPVPAISRYRSNAIEGLYLCGRGCHPGMPLPAALLAAREINRAARGREPAASAPPAA
ncbi:MAG: phytoene desaturase family protein, partial [Gemmatimonadaceae bacterium]